MIGYDNKLRNCAVRIGFGGPCRDGIEPTEKITGVVRVDDLFVEAIYRNGRAQLASFTTEAEADLYVEKIRDGVCVHRHCDAIYIIAPVNLVSFTILIALLLINSLGGQAG